MRAVVREGNTIYIGGKFSYVGPVTGAGVPLSAETGEALRSFPRVFGTVHASVSDGSGGWYIGGSFSTVGGLPRSNLAHVLADGSVSPWDPNADGEVDALGVSGGMVYAGGYFTSIGGQARNHIAALDTTTGAATDWNPNADYYVHALAVSGGTVYAGGSFTSIGGQARNRIAALDAATGAATTWDPNAGGQYPYVYALAVSESTVYAGGEFTSIGGQARKFIAALDATTGAATAWDPNAGGIGSVYASVYALAVDGSTVYAGGYFTSIGGQTRNHIAALDATTGAATDWNPNANDAVDALALSGSTVYAGGYFTSVGGQVRLGVAALDATTGAATAWSADVGNAPYYPYMWARVLALAVSGSAVYAGGYFTSIGGQARNCIAALDATTG
ncbi:MAG TPA: hypothetical protein VMS88_08945, partial [Terriglobales bacterium]|nr:hypothetical protein [Terriglobales bacterium]